MTLDQNTLHYDTCIHTLLLNLRCIHNHEVGLEKLARGTVKAEEALQHSLLLNLLSQDHTYHAITINITITITITPAFTAPATATATVTLTVPLPITVAILLLYCSITYCAKREPFCIRIQTSREGQGEEYIPANPDFVKE